MSEDAKAYDLDALKRGRQTILDNITAMEIALKREHTLLVQYDQEIAAAEKILRAHNVECPPDMHDWAITATFSDGITWKQRHCKRCPIVQRILGNK